MAVCPAKSSDGTLSSLTLDARKRTQPLSFPFLGGYACYKACFTLKNRDACERY